MKLKETLEKYDAIFKTQNNYYQVNKGKREKNIDYFSAYLDFDKIPGEKGYWGMIDKDGNEIVKPIYVFPFVDVKSGYLVTLPYEEDEEKISLLKCGLLNKDGKTLVPVDYLYMESMDSTGSLFRVMDKETYKSGVIDKNNNVIVPLIYEFVEAEPDEKLCNGDYPEHIYQVLVSDNDLYGVYDIKLKKEIIKPKYKYMRIIGYNKFLIGNTRETCTTLINEKEGKI